MGKKTTEVSTKFSANVVGYFNGKLNFSLKEIGDCIGQKRAFVSMVKKGERSLTIEHLFALQNAVNEPLPVLIYEALEEQTPAPIKERNADLYNLLKSLSEPLLDAAKARSKKKK